MVNEQAYEDLVWNTANKAAESLLKVKAGKRSAEEVGQELAASGMTKDDIGELSEALADELEGSDPYEVLYEMAKDIYRRIHHGKF